MGNRYRDNDDIEKFLIEVCKTNPNEKECDETKNTETKYTFDEWVNLFRNFIKSTENQKEVPQKNTQKITQSNLSKIIREYKTKNNLSYGDLERMTGIPRKTINDWGTGRRVPHEIPHFLKTILG